MADPDIHIPVTGAVGNDIPRPMVPPMPSAPVLEEVTTVEDTGVVLTQSQRNILRQQGYTDGLIEALITNQRAFDLAIWVIDNSGSMQTRDGHRIVENNSNQKEYYKFVPCTRWAEMQQTVDYHAQLAALLHTPTTFRLLNDPGRVAGPQEFSIAVNNKYDDTIVQHELNIANTTMKNAQPGGVTPLYQHIMEIRTRVLSMESSLRQRGTKVAVILATDGLPTDMHGHSSSTVKQQFVEGLRSLEGLPIWIVIRLCTDEESVVEFFNSLDTQLEISLECLDDFVSEAEEVHEQNPWLTYGLPLHRMREMGFHHRIFDLLDERKLSKDEIRDVSRLFFGSGILDEAPDPEVDWKEFCNTIEQLNNKEQKQWDTVHKKLMPWIDMKQLKKEHGGGGGWFGLFS